jgi:hypothetical protein
MFSTKVQIYCGMPQGTTLGLTVAFMGASRWLTDEMYFGGIKIKWKYGYDLKSLVHGLYNSYWFLNFCRP